jgi:putative transposase
MYPVVIVPKPNGSWRLCVDMRSLNKCMHADPYLLPVVEEMHAAMGGCQLWSNMYLLHKFWQAEATLLSQFGLTTPHGNFELSCMQMVVGMQSAPSTYWQLMSHTLTGVEGAKAYIIDTFTFTADFQGQLRALHRVSKRTREITTTPPKCWCCVQEVVRLRHLVSAKGICPVMDKAAAVLADL